jgi:hypothetical protein
LVAPSRLYQAECSWRLTALESADGKRCPFRYFNSSPEVIRRVVIDVRETSADEEWWWAGQDSKLQPDRYERGDGDAMA